MAVTARFLADFSSFNDAVQKAEARLTDFTSGASRVEKALARMTDSFSGRRVIQEATLMERAIADFGGVAKLTADDLKRVESTASAAAAKLKAIGGDASRFEKLAEDARKASAATSTFGDKLQTINGLLGGLGVGLSVGALVSFGKTLLDDADALVKMSDRTGVSITGLQRLQAAGDDAGNSIEDMTGAINQMQNRLASGDASATGALQKLGLALEDLQKLSPDQQFIAISDAIRGVNDPAQQVAIAMDLFGKTGAQVLPTLKRGFDDLRDSAVGMSEDTARALDEAGDALAKWWREAKGVAAEAVVYLGRAAAAGFNPVQMVLNDTARLNEQVKQQIAEMTAKASGPALFTTPPPMTFTASESALKAFDREMDESRRLQEQAAAAAKKAAEEYRQWANVVQEVMQSAQGWVAVLDTIDGSTLEAIRYYREQGVSLERLAKMYGLTAVQAEAYATAEKLAGQAAQINTRIQVGLGNELEKVGRVATELGARAMPQYNVGLVDVANNTGIVTTRSRDVQQTLQGVSQAFGVLAQVSGDTFGGMAQEIGSVLAQMNALQQSAQLLGVNLSTVNAGLLTIGLNIIGALGAAQMKEDAINDAIIEMAMNAERAYSEQAGRLLGIDMSRAYLDAIHHANTLAEAQQRVNDLVSAMGRQQALINEANNKYGPSQSALEQQAAHAKELLDYMTQAGQRMKDGTFIPDFTPDQINKAYYDWQKAMADAGNAAAKAWVEANDGAQEYATGLAKMTDALKQRRNDLAQSIANEAPEQVMGVVEAQTRGQMAALDAQIADQQAALQKQADDAASDLEQTLSNVKPDAVHVPVVWDVPPLPTGVQTKNDFKAPPLDPIPMAAGGYGRVTKPTLFLAGEAGPEDVAFSGGGKSFRGSGAVTLQFGDVNVTAAPGDDPRTLAERFLEALRTNAALYSGIQVIAERAVA